MEAEWLAVIVASGGIVIALLTLIFAARQTKALAAQTKTQNNLAVSSELRSMHVHLHTVLAYLVEHPDLRQYFYGGADWRTVADNAETARIDIIAEMLQTS
ncbi:MULTISPECIES: hypothetical protein [Actinomycetes]|uniref:hypothetical protein n=1 Tax=Actinomycetes TaxID=1760 RepID=UPI0004C28047|nr:MULTISPECIES: hypothetical protein [Actinomycetes]